MLFPMGAAVDRRVLRLVGEVMGLLQMDELCEGLLLALRQAIPAEFCAINEVPGDVDGAISVCDPPMTEANHRAWVRYGHQNPLADHFMRTRDGRPTRFSDLLSRRELHRLEIYTEIYAPLGVEYQIAFMLPSRSRRVLGVALSRAHRDFTAAERELLGVARPYLIQAYRNALAFSGVCRPDGLTVQVVDLQGLGLTLRQAEVLRLVAMGRSDQHTADALGIGIRTVQKHLERSYRELGVSSRSEAAGLVWDQTARDRNVHPQAPLSVEVVGDLVGP
jgi:DNA-binding CsgD family transcriptional regulator